MSGFNKISDVVKADSNKWEELSLTHVPKH